MWKILELDSIRSEKNLRDNFWDPNHMTYYYESDITTIQKTKEEIGKIFWMEYIIRLIKSAIKKNTLLWKIWKKTWKIPIYITTHLDRMDIEELQEAVNILNDEIAKVKSSMKIDLMIIRNNMINRIRGR